MLLLAAVLFQTCWGKRQGIVNIDARLTLPLRSRKKIAEAIVWCRRPQGQIFGVVGHRQREWNFMLGEWIRDSKKLPALKALR